MFFLRLVSKFQFTFVADAAKKRQAKSVPVFKRKGFLGKEKEEEGFLLFFPDKSSVDAKPLSINSLVLRIRPGKTFTPYSTIF